MPATTEKVSLTLRPETLAAVDAIADAQERSRSQVIDQTLRRTLIKENSMKDDGLSARQRQIETGAPELRSRSTPPVRPHLHTPSIGEAHPMQLGERAKKEPRR